MSEIDSNQNQKPKRNWFKINVDDDVKSAIIFLCIAAVLFIAFIGFFTWHTVRMRSFELEYIRMYGEVVDIKVSHSTSSNHRSTTSYYYVISYTYDEQEYTFTDSEGHSDRDFMQSNIGKYAEIYVDPLHPNRAEVVTSSPFVSILCAIFFAFFCVTYAAGMNILLKEKGGSSFIKRLLCVWGAEILLGVAVLLLFWLSLPNSGFGEVFARINGAHGIVAVIGFVVAVIGVDGIITSINKDYRGA